MKRPIIEIGMRFFLGSVVLLAWGGVGLPVGATETPTNQQAAGAGSPTFTQRVMERMKVASYSPPSETADAVLIRTKEWKWNRYLKHALNLPDWIDFGLENRTRFETLDHSFRRIQSGTGPQVFLRSRVRLGVNLGVFGLLFEGEDSRTLLDNPGDFVNASTVNQVDILQLLGSLSLENVMGTGLRTDVHFGRLTMDFGKRRLIARNDFRNTTNAFEGVHWQIGEEKSWRIRAFFVEPVLRDDIRFDAGSKNSLFWGTFIENFQISWMHVNVFYFGLNDQRFQNITLNRTYGTYGVRGYKPDAVGGFDYEFDGAIQTGRFGEKDHFAFNPNVEVGYTFDIPWTPRFLVQYVYASGTRNPTGSQSQNFDPLFGARRFDLMPTGIFGPFVRSNISSPGWRIIVKPEKGWTFQFKHRVWYLAQSRGPFVGGALQDPTGGSGKFLGHDVELRAVWKINDNLEFDAGYDHWFKGSYFDRLPASAGLPPGGNLDTDYFYIFTKFRM